MFLEFLNDILPLGSGSCALDRRNLSIKIWVFILHYLKTNLKMAQEKPGFSNFQIRYVVLFKLTLDLF